MDVHVTCPHCNQTVGVRYTSEQTEKKCGACGQIFSLPAIEDMTLEKFISIEKELQSSRKDVHAILLELQKFHKSFFCLLGLFFILMFWSIIQIYNFYELIDEL